MARVYRELWLSLVSIPPLPKELPCVHRREEAPAARKGWRLREEPEVREREREGVATGERTGTYLEKRM